MIHHARNLRCRYGYTLMWILVIVLIEALVYLCRCVSA